MFSIKGKTANKKYIFIFLLAFVITFSVSFVSSAETVNGKIETIKGKTVLYLWGNSYEKGYAHGFLLAEEIIDILENYMLGEMYDIEDYWYTTVLLRYYVRVPLAFQREILGMYNGMVDALGEEGIYSSKLYRNFSPIDLIRWNMFEIFPLKFEESHLRGGRKMCSSVSAWGDGTKDGSVLIARNLDFGSPGDMSEQLSIIIAYKKREGFFSKKDWVSFAWPGFIGCITGMNEDGVGAAVHYGNSNPYVEDLFVNVPWYYTPLSFVLRQGLETRRYGINKNPIKKFFRLINAAHNAGSFNIHVFAPYISEDIESDPPAAVIEGNNEKTSLRTYKDNRKDEPKLFSDHFLAVTNNHRKIIEPEPCERYETIVNALNAVDFLDMETALEIERDVVQTEEPYHTIQMIGFNADTKEFWVAFGEGENHSYEVEPVHFYWDEIFQ